MSCQILEYYLFFKMRLYLTVLISSLIILINSCNKIKYYPDKVSGDVQTLILAHKAGGGVLSSFQENSFEAAENSFSIVNGVEVDIQISKNGTIWLSHNTDLPDCDELSYGCFPEAYDSQIVELDTCNGNLLNYSRLEDIFSFMSENYSNSYISLDVKAWFPCSAQNINVLEGMLLTANEIIRLTEKYELRGHVMVESSSSFFLNYMKKNGSGIECYLLSFGNIERAIAKALENDFAGISYKYSNKDYLSADHITLLRKKGLKIQLWTVNTEEDIEEALSINPDFIQTDNLDYFKETL